MPLGIGMGIGLTMGGGTPFNPLTDSRFVAFFDTQNMGRTPVAVVTDSFDRANSASSLGSADTGQAWTAHTGTWGISGNKAYTPVPGIATVETGSADGVYDGTAVLGTSITDYLVFRFADVNNFHYVGMSSNAIALRQVIAGVNTVTNSGVDTATVPTSAQGDTRRLTVRAVGAQIEVLVDGIQYIAATMPNATMTALGSNTRAGLRTNDTTLTYNDYSASTPGLVSGVGTDAWIDRKGLSTATQTDPTRRFPYKVVGGVPSVRGGTAGGGLNLTFPAGVNQENCTVFWVGYNPTSPTAEQIILALPAYTTFGLIQANGQVMARQAGYEYSGLAQASAAPQVYAVTGLSASSPAAPGRGVRMFAHGQRVFRTQASNAAVWGTGAITTGFMGGITTGSGSFNFAGITYGFLVCNASLTRAEERAAAQWLVNYYHNTSIAALVTPTQQAIFDGDSLTEGNTGTGLTTTYPDVVIAGLVAPTDSYNLGVSGQTLVQMAADFATQVAPLYDASLAKQFYLPWGGTNDLAAGASGATVYANYVAQCLLGQAAGFLVLADTNLPRGTSTAIEAERQIANGLIRLHHAEFSNGFIDSGNDASGIGAWGDQDNLTNYQVDKIHLKAPGYAIKANLVLAALGTL